jgi:hypothetical protein
VSVSVLLPLAISASFPSEDFFPPGLTAKLPFSALPNGDNAVVKAGPVRPAASLDRPAGRRTNGIRSACKPDRTAWGERSGISGSLPVIQFLRGDYAGPCCMCCGVKSHRGISVGICVLDVGS